MLKPLTPLERDRHVHVITHIIEFLRNEEASEGKPIYLEIEGLQLTPEFEADLLCVGLDSKQYEDSCIISWRSTIEPSKNCHDAEKENRDLKEKGPTNS